MPQYEDFGNREQASTPKMTKLRLNRPSREKNSNIWYSTHEKGWLSAPYHEKRPLLPPECEELEEKRPGFGESPVEVKG